MSVNLCNCTGVRYCRSCLGSERVQNLIRGLDDLKKPQDVIANQFTDKRTSSCSFLQLREASLWICVDCGNTFHCTRWIRSCADHSGCQISSDQVDGFFVQRDGITAEEETALLKCLDTQYSWKDSQSGRRKQEYGPKKNFKKKKVKPPEVPGMPAPLQPLLEAAAEFAFNRTGGVFQVAEASVLEYNEERSSGFDPHIDDTWLWGQRIVGANLLAECPFSFVSRTGVSINVLLPRRAFFMMSGKSRYEWLHGIHPELVRNRRVSITMRELSEEVKQKDPDVCEAILQNAHLFV